MTRTMHGTNRPMRDKNRSERGPETTDYASLTGSRPEDGTLTAIVVAAGALIFPKSGNRTPTSAVIAGPKRESSSLTIER
jgi:hypothetical protein